ncbi:hypothetical protein CORC01_03373 [Colletotrichum orchidophilum]|uniref:Uncharacterized protein n=1 Tax=Colletotrichum orchidophilum TaxID=1209926 RepID=A0A1G4BIM1_9PEZI|nr:uncharacterized protein CORC01_03373 [Colletotrichum orchidophilum]OHF01340.1 hypothetical protein CORC01_03373 [Colletotrichum orchidophilum]
MANKAGVVRHTERGVSLPILSASVEPMLHIYQDSLGLHHSQQIAAQSWRL